MIEKFVDVAREIGKKMSDNIPEFAKESRESSKIPDFSNGITTRNAPLEGKEHPETGVRFERKEIETGGEIDEGVFPDFDETTSVELPSELYEATDKEQFKYCNQELKEQIDNDPKVREQFSDEQIEQINANRTPNGYTWHHHEDKGRMELVDTETHARTGHTGGRVIWGGGQENR